MGWARSWSRGVRFLAAAAPKTFWLLTAGAVAVALLLRASNVLLGILVGELSELGVDEGLGAVFGVIVALVSTWLAIAVLNQVAPWVERDLIDATRVVVGDRLLSVSLAGPDMSTVESEAFAARVSTARGELTGVPAHRAVLGYSGLLGWSLGIVTAAVILATFRWWLLPLPLAAMLVQFRWFMHVWDRTFMLVSDPVMGLRHARYVHGLGLAHDSAKEIRLFAFGQWSSDRYADLSHVGMREAWRRRGGWWNTETALSAVVTVAALAVSYVVIARAAARGDIGVGRAVVYLQMATALTGTAGTALRNWKLGLRAIEQLDEPSTESSAGGLGHVAPSSVLGGPARAVRFDEVAFSYVEGHRRVLDVVDLVINAGESAAIVGENGAGKTTLMKVLAGLYAPSGGRVVIDGVDLADMDRGAWQSRVSVVFQDFFRYQGTLLDNVALAARDEVDLAALDEAADVAGIVALVERLPQGWDTVLSPLYEGGVDLSGGQWQRVALARGLYAAREGGLLVLDEPTANLDIQAEADVFNRLIAARAGLTTILISHRFTTVRRTDRIHVLEGGCVTESGTHDELLRAGGRYARMFRAQASLFGRVPSS